MESGLRDPAHLCSESQGLLVHIHKSNFYSRAWELTWAHLPIKVL